MTAQRNSAEDRIWRQVERDKRIDRLLRLVTIGAWAIAFALVLVFVVLTGIQIAETVRLRALSVLPSSAIIGSAVPLFIVLGTLSVLIATLGTVAIFLRLRTASLLEIQLRLAALEEMLASRADDKESAS